MKKLVLISLMLVLCSCHKGMVDWYPVNFIFTVHDANGNDCLSLESPYFIGDRISVEYNGEVYKYQKTTKVYLAQFSGLDIDYSNTYGCYYLSFGEFDGSKDQNLEIIVHLPDNTTRNVRLKRVVYELSLKASTHWYVDGKKSKLPIELIL